MDTSPVSGAQATAPSVPGFDPVRILGQGGQGQVWLLSPQSGGSLVAAKVLGPGHAPAGNAAAGSSLRHNESQLTQEWRVLSQFHHDHLLPIHRMVRDGEGSAVLLMEFAAGGSLAWIVHSRGRLSIGEAVTVLTPLGQALAYLHARGAVHGDISPGNILFTAAGKPLLADFGFGRLVGQAPGPLTGTPGFYCPTDQQRDPCADVYALACVGWFALTGKPAPRTLDRMPLAAYVKDVPGELVAALEGGLNENPQQRPTAAAFAQAIFRSARAEAVALGTTVHPSVLPDLPTRRDLKVRRHHPGPMAKWRRMPTWLRRGTHPSLARMWSSGGQRRQPQRHPRRRAWPVIAVAALVLSLAMAGMVAGGPGLNWLWGTDGGEPQILNTGVPSNGAPSVEGEENISGWAGALPWEIQRALVAQDPVAALPALAWTRAYAISHADPALLAKVNVPESAAAAADQAIVEALMDRGHTLSGLEISIVEASRVDPPTAAESATIVAVVTTSAFAEQDPRGVVVHKHGAAEAQKLAIVLARLEGRWVVAQVQPPP